MPIATAPPEKATLPSVPPRLADTGGGGGCDAQLVNAQTPNVAMVVTKRCIYFPPNSRPPV
jgi:hypothetical protein